MSKYVVTSAFQDKFTKVHYEVGSAYESEDAERVTFLQEEGFLGEEVQDTPGKEVQEAPEVVTPEKKGKDKKQNPPESPPNE